MADVLFISKPIAPPWNDGAKNIVRDLAAALTRHRAVVLTRPHQTPEVGSARLDPIYPSSSEGGFAPGLQDNARVAMRLLVGKREDLWHFFFAPNPRTSQVGRIASRLRRARTVQTIASAPRAGTAIRPLLFADVHVVLSRHTEKRLLEDGVPADRVHRISPPLHAPTLLTEAARRAARERFGGSADRPLVVYPGDLEHGDGARRIIDAFALLNVPDARLVMACRPKTAAARDVEKRLRAGLDEDRVTWLGEIADIHALLSAADVVALPTTDLYAKVDHPLVLLEAMALERPVLVVDGSPAAELADGGAAICTAADPEAVASALRSVLGDLARARALGVGGRARVLQENDPHRVADAHEGLYDALL